MLKRATTDATGIIRITMGDDTEREMVPVLKVYVAKELWEARVQHREPVPKKIIYRPRA